MNKKQYFKLALALFSFIFVLFISHRLSPELIEKTYANHYYIIFIKVLSKLTGIIPFSLAEVLISVLVLSFIIYTIFSFVRIFSSPFKSRKLFSFFTGFFYYAAAFYFLFFFMWGLNYHRMPLSQISHLEAGNHKAGELAELCEDLIEKANNLRQQLPENNNHVSISLTSSEETLKRAILGYKNAAIKYSWLSESFSRPKGVHFSKIMSYAGISGVYFPYTAEANVNMDIPEFFIPSTACHEMAHQQGFAREDEANFIAYLTCSLHPDIDFQYSGTLLALVHSMNALHYTDKKTFLLLQEKYSDALKRDLQFNREYWKDYEGLMERLSSTINNSYLKLNNQKDGIQSYGRMVDLLLAYYRETKSI